MGRLIIPSLGIGVRIPLGSLTFEKDTEPIGCPPNRSVGMAASVAKSQYSNARLGTATRLPLFAIFAAHTRSFQTPSTNEGTDCSQGDLSQRTGLDKGHDGLECQSSLTQRGRWGAANDSNF